jgi:hypothetical protein
MIAYCYRSGHIGFADHVIPEGALPIKAHDDAKKLKEVIHVCARWSYPTIRGGKDSKPLVPGIPEANNENEAYEALKQFTTEVEKRLPLKI